MARVTKNPDKPKKPKGELSGATVVQPKKKKPGVLFSCLGITIIAILLGILAIAWVVAATGLVNIPVVSRFAYEEPDPIRYVSPGVSLESHLETSLEDQVAQQLRENNGQLQDTSLDITIPESSFTTSLRDVLQEQAGGEMLFAANESQVVFDSERKLEFFFPLRNNDQNSALRLYLEPSVENGDLAVEATDMWLGALHIPGPLTELFVQNNLEQNTESLKNAISAYITLQEIEVHDKNMTIRGDLNANIFRIE